MSEDPGSKATEILATLTEIKEGEAGPSAEELLPLVYDELRGLAARYMARERRDHTLRPTALVHEGYLRLVDQTRVNWKGRTHFFAVGARVMRRILVDHARRHRSEKRGGERQKVTLAEAVFRPSGPDMDLDQLLELNAAMDRLAELDERQARVVELRFFGGLTTEETAEALGVSKRTVEGDWTHARAWLRRELSGRDGS
jgi:RNA polymerase sigma factor (TIGR02999 family)